MAVSGVLVTLVIIIVVAFSIYNEYYPDGLSQPLLMKTTLFVSRTVKNTLLFLDHLGVADYLQAKRRSSEYMSKGLVKIDPHVQIEDTTIEGIPVRIYQPTDHSNVVRLPGMVYYHGGGWTIGSIDTHHPVTIYFSREVKMVVISVGYRLNPEYSQKDGLDDCVTVTKHVIQKADDYRIDAGRVVVAGDSAGGNYASVVPLVLRDEHFTPMPKLQMLIYPMVQAIDLQLPSYQENALGPLLTSDELYWFLSNVYATNDSYMPYFETNTHVPGYVRQRYANDLLNHNNIPHENRYAPYTPPNYDSGDSEIWDAIRDRFLDPYHFPLMASNHSALPEAYIFTGQYDLLRDEGYLYARVLQHAGVKVTHFNSRVGWHAMINFVNINTDSLHVMEQMCAFLHENL